MTKDFSVKQIPSDFIRKKSSTIPFGYELSDYDGYLKPIKSELRVLEDILDQLAEEDSRMSLNEGAKLIKHKTGRKISRTGLLKLLKKKRGIHRKRISKNTNTKDIDQKKLSNLWNSGAYSMNKLGKHFNVSGPTIKAHLNRARSQGYKVNEGQSKFVYKGLTGSKQLINAARKNIEYSSALDIHIANQIKKLMNNENIMSEKALSEYLGVPAGKIRLMKMKMSLRGEYLNGYVYKSKMSTEEEVNLFNTVMQLTDQGMSIQKICDLTGESRSSIHVTVYKNYK